MPDFDNYLFELFHGFTFLIDSVVEVEVVAHFGKGTCFRYFLSLLGVDVETLIRSPDELILVEAGIIRYDDF